MCAGAFGFSPGDVEMGFRIPGVDGFSGLYSHISDPFPSTETRSVRICHHGGLNLFKAR